MPVLSRLLALLLLILLTACAAKPRPQPEPAARIVISRDLTAVRLAEDVFVVTDMSFHQSNFLVAKMDPETVLIASSPMEDESAEQLMSWIQAELKPRRMLAVNTHFHADGTGANAVYHRHGVETWASEQTRRLHIERAEYYRQFEAEGFPADSEQRRRILKRSFAPAQQVFAEQAGKTFSFARGEAQVFYPGPAHTRDNVVVWLPNQKILFGGCMIKLGSSLGYLADADVPAWEASAQKLKRFEAEIVVPGHGLELGDAGAIDHTIELARQALQK